jgi:hypothetical protein
MYVHQPNIVRSVLTTRRQSTLCRCGARHGRQPESIVPPSCGHEAETPVDICNSQASLAANEQLGVKRTASRLRGLAGQRFFLVGDCLRWNACEKARFARLVAEHAAEQVASPIAVLRKRLVFLRHLGRKSSGATSSKFFEHLASSHVKTSAKPHAVGELPRQIRDFEECIVVDIPVCVRFCAVVEPLLSASVWARFEWSPWAVIAFRPSTFAPTQSRFPYSQQVYACVYAGGIRLESSGPQP